MRIGAFKGKDSENNRLIIEALALNGSLSRLVKYDIYKTVKKEKKKQDKKIAWSTISRRVDDLKERGYIQQTGTRKIIVGKREEDSPTYGITWRGLIASVESSEVRHNILAVLQKNPQLELPESFLAIIRKLFTEEEINQMALKLTEAIRILPFDLESLKNEAEIVWHVILYLDKVGFEIPSIDLKSFQQSPEFLQWIQQSLPDYEKSLERVELLKKLIKEKSEGEL